MAVFQCAIIKDARAQFRHQHQKLRGLPTELLAEFRGQARISSMIAPSKTVFFFYISRVPRLTFFLSVILPGTEGLRTRAPLAAGKD